MNAHEKLEGLTLEDTMKGSQSRWFYNVQDQ